METLATKVFNNPKKVSDVKRWFAERMALHFAKEEIKMKRCCGMVTPGVLSDAATAVAVSVAVAVQDDQGFSLQGLRIDWVWDQPRRSRSACYAMAIIATDANAGIDPQIDPQRHRSRDQFQ